MAAAKGSEASVAGLAETKAVWRQSEKVDSRAALLLGGQARDSAEIVLNPFVHILNAGSSLD
jgi:hypothetical protein